MNHLALDGVMAELSRWDKSLNNGGSTNFEWMVGNVATVSGPLTMESDEACLEEGT